MYHYVRDLKRSRYPAIKGLDIEDFIGQIDYIRRHYQVIGADEMMDLVESGEDFPPNALMLTFDDGYIDHFTHVFPILDEKKLSGCFFPSAACVLENQVMDVNKIHFVLASVEDKGRLVDHIHDVVQWQRQVYDLKEPAFYWNKLARAGRFDSAEVMFIKRMLQLELPQPLRSSIVDELFALHVSSDEAAFAAELYMNAHQLACMKRNGMHIGCHGYHHLWLGHLTPEDQAVQIDLSMEFLKNIGCDLRRWIMCYPHGSFDNHLIDTLKDRRCVLGLTIQAAVADLKRDDPLLLPRLNTNDIPKQR